MRITLLFTFIVVDSDPNVSYCLFCNIVANSGWNDDEEKKNIKQILKIHVYITIFKNIVQ